MSTANGYAPGYATNDLPSANLSVTIGQRVNLPEMPDDARAIRRHIESAWKAYKGDWKEQMPLKVDRGEPDDNTQPNRCGPIVDKGVSFLFGEAPKIEVKDKTGKKDGPVAAQNALDEALGDTDDLMTVLTMLAMNGGVAGHTFSKLIPANTPANDSDQPRIVVQDPKNYWVVTDPHDVNCVLTYNCEYDLPSVNGKVMTQRVVTEREGKGKPWTICTYIRERPMTSEKAGVVSTGNDGGGAWTLVAEEDWQYKWAPIHDCMNLPNPNEYWGISDLPPDLIHLNVVLNDILSDIKKVTRMNGVPFTYATNLTATDITIGPGKIVCFPGEKTTVGAVQWAGDIANMRAFAGDIRSDMDEQSRVPAVALGRVEELPRVVSGVALQILYQPLLEKTILKRRMYGKLIRDLCEHILEMLGFPGLKVHIVWQELLPIDDLAAAQTAQILIQSGVISPETAAGEMGYEWEVEQQHLADAAQKQLDNYAKGQGMPPNGNAGGMGPQGPVSSSSAPQGVNNGGNGGPPVNSPAAVRQRGAVQAVSQAMKAGVKVGS